MATRRSLGQTFRLNMVMLTVIVMTVFAYFWITREIQQFRQESAAQREAYLESQKTILKNAVEQALTDIRNEHARAETRLKQTIQDRVEEAYRVAWNIYAENEGQKPPAEIQKIIKDALRPIRFNHGRGYYFAVNVANGVEELFADQPELEGRSLLDWQDTQGRLVVKEMIALIKQSCEGFYQYTWMKPNAAGQGFPKIAFIKRFEPYDWLLGTGEYLDDVQADIQTEVLTRLVAVRFETEGYLFASTYTGDPLFTNGQITRYTESVWDLTDPYGVKIIQEERKIVAQPEGGFLRYSWKKLTNPEPSPKISFVKGVPEWQWIVGAGVYIDDIEQVIRQKKAALNRQIKRDLVTILGALLTLLGGVLLLAQYRADKIHRSFQTFAAFFDTAATQSAKILTTGVHFAEFEGLAQSANRMIDERKRLEAERQQAEHALRESEARYRTLVETSPAAILVHAAGRIVYVNTAAVITFGATSKADLLGRPALALVHPDERAAVSDRISRMLEHGTQAPPKEERFVRLDGKEIVLQVAADRIEYQGQAAAQVFGVDMTARIRAEEEIRSLNAELEQRVQQRTAELEAANRELQSFAYIVSHDLKAPLRGINQITHWLLEDYAQVLDAPGKEMLDLLGGRVKRMDAMIDGVLQYSRVGRVEGRTEPIDLNRLVREVIELLALPPQMQVVMEQEFPTVLGNPTRFSQIFQNLVGNAVKFMDKPDGEIRLGCVDCGDCWQFSVADNGPGIAPEHYEKIFQIFQTLKPRDEQENTGIGLAIVKKIVEWYGGKIWVESTVGQGSIFVFTLPKRSAQW